MKKFMAFAIAFSLMGVVIFPMEDIVKNYYPPFKKIVKSDNFFTFDSGRYNYHYLIFTLKEESHLEHNNSLIEFKNCHVEKNNDFYWGLTSKDIVFKVFSNKYEVVKFKVNLKDEDYMNLHVKKFPYYTSLEYWIHSLIYILPFVFFLKPLYKKLHYLFTASSTR